MERLSIISLNREALKRAKETIQLTGDSRKTIDSVKTVLTNVNRASVFDNTEGDFIDTVDEGWVTESSEDEVEDSYGEDEDDD